jgi:excisionase family DNA binding protein
VTAREAPPRRAGRPSNLSRLGPRYAAAPLLTPPTQALLLAEIAGVLAAASEAIRLLADSVREAPAPAVAAPDYWLTLSEASTFTKLSRDTLVRYVQRGTLRVIRDPDGQPFRPYRIARESLEGL